MDDIKDIRFEQITSSQYVRPMRMHFTQESKPRAWDLMLVHDSVAGLLYHTEKRSLIFVKQFRPAVYVNRVSDGKKDLNTIDWSKHPKSLGITYELCAGIVDKDMSLESIMREEYLQECGFDVKEDKIEKVTSFRSGIGVSSSLQTIFYAQVDDSNKVSEGGGDPNENERIELAYVSIDEAKQMAYDESIAKPSGLMFALLWFYEHKAKLFGFSDTVKLYKDLFKIQAVPGSYICFNNLTDSSSPDTVNSLMAINLLPCSSCDSEIGRLEDNLEKLHNKLLNLCKNEDDSRIVPQNMSTD